MGAREKNAAHTFTLTSTLALCVFLSAPTQGWGQNTSDPFAPDYVAPSEPVATPKAPAPTAPVLPTRSSTPAAQPAPVKTAPVIEETVTQASPTPAPEPVTPAPKPAKTANLSTPDEPGVADNDSSFLEKLSDLFSSEEPEEAPTKEAPAPEVKEATAKNAAPVEPSPAPTEMKEPAPRAIAHNNPVPPAAINPAEEPSAMAENKTQADNPSFLDKLSNLFSNEAPEVKEATVESTSPVKTSSVPTAPTEPVAHTTVTNDPFSPASISPVQPTAAPTSPPPVTPSQPTTAEATTTMTGNQIQADEPSFPDKEQKSTPKPRMAQSVVQKTEQPSTEPESAQAPRKPASEEPGFFERIGNALISPFSTEEEEEPETLAPTQEKDAQPIPSVKEKSEPTKETPPSQTTPQELDPRLRTAKLGLGKDILLGQGDNQLSKQAKCFTKNRGTVAFCTTPTRWPDPIARHFQVSTHLYKGVRGIIKYDGAIATRLYAIFDSDGFNEVIQYFEKQYGPATNTFNRQTRLLKENIDNKSYIWRRPNPDEGLVEVMEIRQFTDMRGPRPDLGHSTIRLYFEGSREIFSMTSDLDFMHLR